MVGTELSKLIPEWAVNNSRECKCRDMAAKMDRWGPYGCYSRRESIITHLMKQSDLLIPAFRFVPDVAKRAIAGRLLNTAIRNARKP